MVFPDFYRLPVFGLAVFCGKAWRKKYRSEARMIFFQPTSLKGRLAQKMQSKTFAA